MESDRSESDKKLRGSVMRFSQTWWAYKQSQSRWYQTPSRSPSSSSSGSARGHPLGMPRGGVASAANRRLALSNGHKSPSRRDQVASVRSRRENPPPKSRLSVSSGGGGGREYHHREAPLSSPDNHGDMPPLEYDDPVPQSSSNYYSGYYYSPKVDNVARHFRDDAPAPSEYMSSFDYGHSSEENSSKSCVVM